MAAGTTARGPSLESVPVSTTRETESSWRGNKGIVKLRHNSGIPATSAIRRFPANREPAEWPDISAELERAEGPDASTMLELADVSCTRSNV
jgi:hypothetical protein